MKQWRCTNCNHVFEGDAPPHPCPVCGEDDAPPPPEAAAPPPAPAAAPTPPEPAGKEENYVLIGGGVAALAAAKAIRQRNKTAPITMVCNEMHCPYNRTALPRVIADSVPLTELLLERDDYYPANGITLKNGVVAKAINAGEHTVQLSDDTVLPYTKLLLATGATPFNPIKHGHGSIPVKVLRSYEDAMDLVGYAAGRRLVMVGGGILAVEAAVALQKRGAKVTMVEFAPRVMPLQTDEEAAARLAAELQSLGMVLLCNSTVTEATGSGVVLGDGSEMAADLVLASMGVRSEVSLAVAMGLELSRGIIVDEHMRTSHKDIWAAGDCAEFGGLVRAQASAALGMGTAAGASMAGDESAPYKPLTPVTMFNLPNYKLFSAGAVTTEPEEDITRRTSAGDYGRLFLNDGVLTGALFVGASPGARAITALNQSATRKEALELFA